MREILFKAKRLDNNEWVEGYLIRDNYEGSWRIIIKLEYSTGTSIQTAYATRVKPETICQFTGLHDKHGNKIWENDIVCHSIHNNYKAKVVYGEKNCSCCNGVYGWTFEPIGGYSEVCDIRKNDYVYVIGNTIDNPELLEGE